MRKISNISPTILMVNFHSTHNIGDLALLISNRQLLMEAFNNPKIIVSANWPDEPAYEKHGFEVVPSFWSLSKIRPGVSITEQITRFIINYILISSYRNRSMLFGDEQTLSWRSVHDAYVRADIVVGVSGTFFFSSGRYGWPFPATYASIKLANVYKKPLYILPQSIGPLRRKWERTLLFNGYKHARKIYFRDNASINLGYKIGLDSSKMTYSPDTAFDLKPASEEIALEVLLSKNVNVKKPKLGVTIISPIGRSIDSSEIKNYYDTVTKVLEKFLQTQNVQVVMFNQDSGPTIKENDIYYTKKIYEKLLANNLDVVQIDEALAPDIFKACVGKMQAFLASRLHSGVFALGMNVPTVFIGYLSKTRGMLQALELENNVIDLRDLKEQDLWEKLSYTWEHATQERRALEVKMPAIKAASHAPAQAIREDFLRYHG